MGCGASQGPISLPGTETLHATEDVSLPKMSNPHGINNGNCNNNSSNNSNTNNNESREVEVPDKNGISSERLSRTGSSENDKIDSPPPRPTDETTSNGNIADKDYATGINVDSETCFYTSDVNGTGVGRHRSVSPAPGLSEYATLSLRHVHKKLRHNHRVFRICITGGPCAGKSTFLSQLLTKLPTRTGYKVYCVPEAATLMVAGGMEWSEGCVEEQQLALLRVQLALEDQFYNIAMASGQPSVVISDRGTMDGRAFCSPDTFNRILRRLGATLEGLRDRYDAVLHLVTAASGAEAYYNMDNPARYEGLEGAVESDLKLRQVYVGHPMLRIIDNSTSFEEKLERGFILVGQAIGQKFSMHNTSYYLVRQCPKELPVQYAVCTITITVLCNSVFNDIRLLIKRENSSGHCMYFFNSIRNANSQGVDSNPGTRTHSMDGSLARDAPSGPCEDFQAMHDALMWVDAGRRVKNEQRISSTEYCSLIRNRDSLRRDVVLHAAHFIYDDNRYEVTTIVEPIWAAGKQALTLECDDQIKAKFPSFIEIDREVPIDSFSTAFLISNSEMGPLYTSLAYAPVFTRGIMANGTRAEAGDIDKENTNVNFVTIGSTLDSGSHKTEVGSTGKVKKTKKKRHSKHMCTEDTPRLPLESRAGNTVNNETEGSKPVNECNPVKKNLISEFVSDTKLVNESISGAKLNSTHSSDPKLDSSRSALESPSFLHSPPPPLPPPPLPPPPLPPPPPSTPPTANPRGMIMGQH